MSNPKETSLFDDLPEAVSIDAQINECRRELAMRERVYPRWVEGGQINQDTADARIAIMKAIIATLEGVKG